jgi:hypothetical protein
MPHEAHATRRSRLRRQLAAAAVAAAALSAVVATAQGDVSFPSPGSGALAPGNLLISRSDYVADSAVLAGSTELPPGCGPSNIPADPCTLANTSGSDYPQVFNNDSADPSFGITSPIFLDQVNPYNGHLINTVAVPTSELTTSFSSKSELALNLSTSGRYVSFMGYVAPVDTVDASNANTPGEIDPTNPVTTSYYRAVATLDSAGNFHFTETNAYSGDNGRAAVLADSNPGSAPVIFAAGNAGNGSNPQPNGVILGAGAQAIAPSLAPEAFQSPGTPTPVGGFSITQLPVNTEPDKVGKDTNFRGLTVYDNVVYYTKGSGSNGINTVYFIDTSGKACPGTGTGLPQPGAPLPSSPIDYNLSTLQTAGLPTNMCILKGFPTTLAKSAAESNFPFGLWFANSQTLYVADEGNGTNTYSGGSYTAAASQRNAGLEKWVFNSGLGEWQLAYTLRSGLNLGTPYTPVSNPALGYTWPTGDNVATGLPWNPATDGLRNITGRVNPNGTATIWAVSSTVSGNGDQGADPNKVVTITDPLDATAPAPGEAFTTLDAATAGEVLRGVSFTPGTGSNAGPHGF